MASLATQVAESANAPAVDLSEKPDTSKTPPPPKSEDIKDVSAGDPQAALPAADVSMSTDLDKLIPKLLAQARAAETEKATAGKEQAAGEMEEAARYRERADAEYEKNKPKPFAPSAPPAKPDQDTLKQFGSLASMIGIFGSAFTKRPIISALNASSAAMNAERTGDIEAYNRAYQEWQDQIKVGMDKHKLDTEDLKTGLDMLTTDYSAGMAYFKALGAAKSWDAVSALAQIGDAEELGKLHASFVTSGNKATENNLRMNELLLKQQKALREKGVYQDTIEAFKASHPEATPEQVALAEAKALRASQGKTADALPPAQKIHLKLMQNGLNNALDDVDAAINIINKSYAIAGIPGSVRQYAEPLSNLFGSDATAEALFKQKIDELKMQLPGLERLGASRGLKADETYLDEILGGTGFKNSTANTIARLEALRDGKLMSTQKTVSDLLGSDEDNESEDTDGSGSWEDAPVLKPADESEQPAGL